MFDDVVDATEFLEIYTSRDIVKMVRWLERRYREIVVPLVKGNKLLGMFEEPAGQKAGQIIGRYFVNQYQACSSQSRDLWWTVRWLHHGALGELLVARGKKKHKPFIIGLGRGLMATDLQDKDEWHTSEYFRAGQKLEKMR
jgi:hypothetical protein